MKRAFIIHGCGGYPEEGWFPWLKKELEKKGFQVQVPKMPNSQKPNIKSWVGFLKKIVGKSDANTYFIGHSIGCQTILRYLQTLYEKQKIGGAVFVGGWFVLTPLATETKEEKQIAKPWFKTLIDFNEIKKKTKNFVAVFSDNDPYVPLETNVRKFRNKLAAKIIIEHKKGHLGGEHNIAKLPIVLSSLLKWSKIK